MVDVTNTWNYVTFKNPLDTLISVLINIVFNLSDLYQESLVLYNSVITQNWATFGRYTGKIIADVVGKSPFYSNSWTFLNSESIKNRLYSRTSITQYLQLSPTAKNLKS